MLPLGSNEQTGFFRKNSTKKSKRRGFFSSFARAATQSCHISNLGVEDTCYNLVHFIVQDEGLLVSPVSCVHIQVRKLAEMKFISRGGKVRLRLFLYG